MNRILNQHIGSEKCITGDCKGRCIRVNGKALKVKQSNIKFGHRNMEVYSLVKEQVHMWVPAYTAPQE